MDSVQQAARELAQTLATYTGAPGTYTLNADIDTIAEGLADALLDAGLLADPRCRKCNGTGGTDLGGAKCAVCDGTGHRRAET